MAAPSSCNASNIQLAMPSNIINGTSCDTLEAMVASCSPSLLKGSGSPMVTSIMGGAGRKRSAMVNIIAAKTRARYNNKDMEGSGGGDDHSDDQAEALQEEDDTIIEDDYTSSEGLYKPEKKRRLSPEQVRCLERSFEVENKLEPERKLQLARELRLHPRQVAVWFQNRRARWKTKQLEKDYDALKHSYTTLQAHFDALLSDKQELHHQVVSLKAKLQQQGDESNICSESKEMVRAEESSIIKEKNGEIKATTVDKHQEQQGNDHQITTDKQRDGGKLQLQLQQLEVSAALSGTEGSAVSEAINSPHEAIDSGVNSEAGAANLITTLINDHSTSTSTTNYISSNIICSAASAIKTTSSGDLQAQGRTVSPKILALEPIIMPVKAETEEDENYSKYCFFLEDQGAFPWWNSTS